MLSKKNYDLEHPPVKVPGMINVVSFLFGFGCIGAAVVIKLVHA